VHACCFIIIVRFVCSCFQAASFSVRHAHQGCAVLLCNKEPVLNQDVKRLFNRSASVRGQDSPSQCCSSSPSGSELLAEANAAWVVLSAWPCLKRLCNPALPLGRMDTHQQLRLPCAVTTPLQMSAHGGVPLTLCPCGLTPLQRRQGPRRWSGSGPPPPPASQCAASARRPPAQHQGDSESLGWKASEEHQPMGHTCMRVPAMA
jgi:hypothetical protein